MEEHVEQKEKIKKINQTTTEIREDFKLKIDINKWEQKTTNKSTKKLEVIFNIELYSEITSKKWNVYHSFQEIKDLIDFLSQIFPNLLNIPKFKSLEKETSTSLMITNISTAFVEFLKSISHRSDIFNSKCFIDFFKLENHFGDFNKNEPKEMFHITGLKYDVIDMIVLEQMEILIVGCALINNNINNFLSKMTFWNKKEKKGQLNIYKINNNTEKENKYTMIAQAETESEISCLYVPKDSNIILVGYFNGAIEIFKLPKYEGNNNIIINLIPINKIVLSTNNNRIINIGYNSLEKYFYCACYKDIMIYYGKIDNNNFYFELPGSQDDLCGFFYEENYNNLLDLVFEIDVSGKFYIGIINKKEKCVNFIYVLSQEINQITLFKIDLESNHIYIGDKNGNLDIFSVESLQTNTINNESNNNSKNNIIKIRKILSTSLNNENKGIITNIILQNYPHKINDVCYNPKKKEIFIALDNGTVQILSHFKNFPEYIIYDNNPNNQNKNMIINKLYFSKLNSIIYIGRNDKSIYVYQMPDKYNSELNRRLQDTNNLEILNGNKFCKNLIEQGFPNSTRNFIRKALINIMGIKNYV